jgi:hypothetical protein
MVMNPRMHPRGAAPDFELPRPNPNPSVMTDALWWMVCMCLALEPGSQNGGTYADKPGSHNIGNNLPDHGAGDPRTDHSIRHPWNRTGPWWRTKTAGRDWTFPSAQRGLYATINLYTRRIINAMRDPNDTRTDNALFYVLGNTDGDVRTEGYDEIDNSNEASGDDSHAWHIHESWQRRSVGDYGAMWAVLTVYMGWTFADWQRSVSGEGEDMVKPVEWTAADKLVVRTAVADGIHDALWTADNQRDLPDGRVRYSGQGAVGLVIRDALGELATAPIAGKIDGIAGAVGAGESEPIQLDASQVAAALAPVLANALAGDAMFMRAIAVAVADESARRQAE